MSPLKCYSREEILRHLQKFAKESGRPPRRNEPGFGKIHDAAKREFGSWEYALKIAGLQTYKQWRKQRTYGAKIVALLNGNPLTYNEIKKELSRNDDSAKSLLCSPTRLGSALKQCSEVRSIGPRKKRIYFIKGQEVLAQTRLEKIFSEVTDDEEMLFCLLRKPMSKREILQNFPGGKTKCDRLLKELISAKLVYPTEFVAHSRGGSKYNASHLFGNLAGKRYYCRFDCSDEMYEFLIGNIPMKNFDEGNFLSSLIYRLRSILPEEVFEQIWRRLSFMTKAEIKAKKESLDNFLS
jgi:hypothetical protein